MFEILERVEKPTDEEALQYHFHDLIEGTGDSTNILDQGMATMPKTPYVLLFVKFTTVVLFPHLLRWAEFLVSSRARSLWFRCSSQLPVTVTRETSEDYYGFASNNYLFHEHD